MDSVNKKLQKSDPNGNDTTIRVSQVCRYFDQAWSIDKKLSRGHDRIQKNPRNLPIEIQGPNAETSFNW
jgi:hypothetical protein